MANTIKLKNASGSDPGASDLVVGEVAIRTDNGKLFTKKDNGSVAEITGGGGIDDGDKGDITVSNSGGTFTRDNGVVSTAKIADQAVDLTKLPHGTVLNDGKFLRSNNGADPTFETISQYSQSAVFSLFDQASPPVQRVLVSGTDVTIQGNQATGVSKLVFRDINTAYYLKFKPVNTLAATVEFTLPAADGSANHVLKTDGSGVMSFGTIATASIADDAVTLAKMQNVITDTLIGRTTNGTGDLEVLSASSVRGIINVEDGATADQSASEILTLIKTVDGAGSGLDADTLDGISSASFLRSDTNTLLNGILTVGGSSVSGGEGGEIRLTHAPNGSLNGNEVVTDINGNNFRIFESGSNNRGVFIDLTTCSNSASGKLYHNGNDGSGSGLDADLLDGVQGSSYLRSDANDTFTGDLTISGNVYFSDQFRIGDDVWIEDYDAANAFRVKGNQDSNKGFIAFGSQTKKLGCDGASAALTYDGNEVVTQNSNLNASNISSGTIAAARVGDISGNAASADTLDVSNSSTNSTFYPTFVDNNGSGKTFFIDNGSGLTFNPSTNVLTAGTFSGSGASLTNVNATTLDSIDSGSFVRSDASDTLTGSTYTIDSSTDQKLVLKGSSNPYIMLREGSVDKAYFQWNASGHIDIVNNETAETVRIGSGTSGLKFLEGSTIYTVWHSGNDGSGSGLDADTCDGLQVNNGASNNTIVARNANGYIFSTYINTSDNAVSSSVSAIVVKQGDNYHRSSNAAGVRTFLNVADGATNVTNNNQLTNGAGYITSSSAGIPASGGTFTGDIGVSGGAGALTVNANSDIRLTNGNWTGESTKIQHHSNVLYVQGGSSGIYFRAQDGTNRWAINSSGNLLTPDHNGSYDIGSSSRRVRNIYVNDMHFANSTENPNKVDGTWGDWTLQEGEDQIYMLNNRNGKKYSMNLTEIV